MPRKSHIPQSEFPYHVTARSHNGDWFRIPVPKVWRIMCFHLGLIHLFYEVKIHSFVLMHNHFHLIVSTPQGNLSEAMNYFMRETSKDINRLANTKNQVYGERFFRNVISSPLHFEHVYKYVYRNPVSAGICQSCEQYEFSTLYGLLGQAQILVPVVEDSLLFDDPEKTLKWLNTAPTPQNYETLRKALRRTFLKLPNNKWSAVKHTLHQQRF